MGTGCHHTTSPLEILNTIKDLAAVHISILSVDFSLTFFTKFVQKSDWLEVCEISTSKFGVHDGSGDVYINFC